MIGRRKYFYAIWGDVVNTAARMESHGSSGKIQITRATYELIKDEFGVEMNVRCMVTNAKGKIPPNVPQDGMVATAIQHGGEIVDNL